MQIVFCISFFVVVVVQNNNCKKKKMSSSLPLCLRLGFGEGNVEMGFGVRDVKGRGRKQGWAPGEIEPMQANKS